MHLNLIFGSKRHDQIYWEEKKGQFWYCRNGPIFWSGIKRFRQTKKNSKEQGNNLTSENEWSIGFILFNQLKILSEINEMKMQLHKRICPIFLNSLRRVNALLLCIGTFLPRSNRWWEIKSKFSQRCIPDYFVKEYIQILCLVQILIISINYQILDKKIFLLNL